MSFKIELKQQSGKNLATGVIVFFKSYQVCIDGSQVGIIGWKEDSKLCPTRDLGPLESDAVNKFLSKTLKRRVESANYPPEIPEGMFDDEEGKQSDDDDFNS